MFLCSTAAAFLPTWLQTIDHFVPTFYGTNALQTVIFYCPTEGLGVDISVVGGTALVPCLTHKLRARAVKTENKYSYSETSSSQVIKLNGSTD